MTTTFKAAALSTAVPDACALPEEARDTIDAATARLDQAEELIRAVSKVDADKAPANEAVAATEQAHTDALKSRALGDDPGAAALKKLRDAMLNARAHHEGLDLARAELLADLATVEADIQSDVESDLNGIPAQHAQRLWLASQPEIEAAAHALLPLVARLEALHAVTPSRDIVDWLNALQLPGFTVGAAPILNREAARAETELLDAGIGLLRAAGAGEAESALAAVRGYVPLARRAPPAPAKGTSYTTDNRLTRAGEAARAAAAGTPAEAPAMPSPTRAAPRAGEFDVNRAAAMRGTVLSEVTCEFAPRMPVQLAPRAGASEFDPWPGH